MCKLNYLTITHPYLFFAINVVCQFLDARRTSHYTSGYCVFVGGYLVLWKSKNQTVVFQSSTESEYRTKRCI